MNAGGGEAAYAENLRAAFLLGGVVVLFGALLLFTDTSASVRGTPPRARHTYGNLERSGHALSHVRC